jgi:hypothetical protein
MVSEFVCKSWLCASLKSFHLSFYSLSLFDTRNKKDLLIVPLRPNLYII